jgi:hypothetical protein
MLDPFTALSLAGNILQFVDLGRSVLVKTLEIYRSGSTEASRQLEIVTKDLTALTSEIDKGASQCSILNASLSIEDKVSWSYIQVVLHNTVGLTVRHFRGFARSCQANTRSRATIA